MRRFRPKACVHCGKEFTPRSRTHAWCEDAECQRVKNAYQKEERKAFFKRRAKNPEYIRKQKEWYKKNTHRHKQYRENMNRDHPAKWILGNAKTRAKMFGLEFSISEKDISIPNTCPVLGIPLRRGKGRQEDGSPSIDRILPSIGYVRGNIVVVSALANRIKNSATVEQIQAVADFYRKLVTK
jgi:hypothetical protein